MLFSTVSVYGMRQLFQVKISESRDFLFLPSYQLLFLPNGDVQGTFSNFYHQSYY